MYLFNFSCETKLNRDPNQKKNSDFSTFKSIVINACGACNSFFLAETRASGHREHQTSSRRKDRNAACFPQRELESGTHKWSETQ